MENCAVEIGKNLQFIGRRSSPMDIIKKPSTLSTVMRCLSSKAVSITGTNGSKRERKLQKIKAQKITVPARTIQSIIDEYANERASLKKIDLFVADVEGFELEVMKGLDFKKNIPSYILVEAHTDKRLSDIKQFLISRKYEYIDEIGHKDYLFKLRL